MKINKIIKYILTFSLLFFYSGCQENSKNIVISQDNEEIIELNFYGYKTEAINVVAIEEILQSFMKKYPNIKITYESVKGIEYYEILKKRLSSGNYDDIFMIDEDNLNTLKEDQYFEDLSDISTINNFNEISLTQMYEDDGKILYLPTSISAFGLYCNMDLLNKYSQKVPKNEAEFKKVCEYFVELGITPIIANNDISLKTIALAKGLYSLYADNDFNEKIDQINQNSEILSDYLKTGYEFVEEMIKNKYIDTNQTITTQKTSDDLLEFEKGINPFMLTGAWASIRVKNDAPNLNYEVHPYPILESGSVVVTNIDTRICVNAKGKHKKEAKKFVEYMSQPDNMWKFTNSQCSFSPLKENRLPDDIAIQPLTKHINNSSILGSDSRIKYPLWSLSRDGIKELLEGNSVDQALELIKKISNEENNNAKN
ncbi:ABC transporter substrate-binding protein [Thomasclavelia sp.]